MDPQQAEEVAKSFAKAMKGFGMIINCKCEILNVFF